MIVTIQYKELTIEVFDDPSFTQNPDSPTSYDKIYQLEKHKVYRPISQHGIVVYRDNIKIASAILLASAGGTSVSIDSIVIDQDDLVTTCSNCVFSLSLPNLKLNWATEVDWATCFSVRQYKDSYITHGEMTISRIDREGKLTWEYGGADIFVCHSEGEPFQMYEDCIALIDFNGTKYKIDYNGRTL